MNLKKILRAEQWWGHILPPILLFFYTGLFSSHKYQTTHLLVSTFLIIFVSVLTGFTGYFINDLFDIEDDKNAGKSNYVSNFPLWLRISFLPVVCLLIFSVFRLLSFEIHPRELRLYIYVLAINLFLFLIYSVPPLRLKASKWMAPVIDALYSGTFFYLLSFLMAANSAGSPSSSDILPDQITLTSLSLLFFWGFLKGVRNYITHLTDDKENDSISGLHTLATTFENLNLNFYANLLYPFELVCLILFFLFQPNVCFTAVIPCIPFFLLWAIHMSKNSGKKYELLNDLHEVWLPLMLLFQLIVFNPDLYFLLAVHFIIFPYHLYKIYCLFDLIYFHTIFKVTGPIRKK